MQITFIGTEVTNLSIKVDKKSNLKDKFKLSFVNRYNPNDDKDFAVDFTCQIISGEDFFILDLDFIAFFKTDNSIDEGFVNSHFPKMNAPAIAYPFLRSYINTITVNSSFNPIILPTINFQELVKQQEIDEDNEKKIKVKTKKSKQNRKS